MGASLLFAALVVSASIVGHGLILAAWPVRGGGAGADQKAAADGLDAQQHSGLADDMEVITVQPSRPRVVIPRGVTRR